MKNGHSWAMYALVVLAFAVAVDAKSQGAKVKVPAHFTGKIDDYTPSTTKGGPYEMHGGWSLNLRRHGDSVIAEFSADMDMETSDFGVSVSNVKPPSPNVDPTDPTTRGAHTHHILLIAPVQFADTGCPTSLAVPPPTAAPPVTTGGFQFTGTVSVITGNGNQAPFEPAPPSPPISALTVCVTGGPEVEYSNVTLMFGTPASNHFGKQAIHGVVSTVGPPLEPEHRW